MSDEQFQDFHPSQCVILQHQREEGGQGLAPWSWSIFWGSRCQMSNFKTFQPSQCVILQYQGGGEGVRGLAPWSWSIFWVSRCQMKSLLKSFSTSHVFLPSFLLHFLLIPFLPPFLFSLPLWKSSPLLVFPSPLSFFSSIFAGYMFRSVRCFCCLPFT